jgi:hypothetical protein
MAEAMPFQGSGALDFFRNLSSRLESRLKTADCEL